MTRAIHVAFGVVLLGLVGLGGTGRLQDAQGQSSQDQLARSHEAPPDSAQEMELQRLRNLVGRLQEQLATYLLQDQQAQKVDNLQASYERALQQQRALQDDVQRIEAERLKAVAELEQLQATRAEQQQKQDLRQAEFTRLQQLVTILQNDLTETRHNLQEARQIETTARAESQRWQILHQEAQQARLALQEELKSAKAEAQSAYEQIEMQTSQRVQAALAKRQDEFIALEQEIARLSSAQESSLARLKELQEGQNQQLVQARQELAEVQGQLRATQAEFVQVQGQLSETQQQYAEATETLASVREELEQTQTQFSSTQKELTAAVAQTAELGGLKTQLVSVTSARDALEQELSAKAAELTRAQAELMQAQQDLTQSQQQFEAMQQQYAEATEALASVRGELEQTQAQL
ncbi:MAG TPA: hypothetical protein VIG57_09650, partial [Candidatus Entotheonella sp.]